MKIRQKILAGVQFAMAGAVLGGIFFGVGWLYGRAWVAGPWIFAAALLAPSVMIVVWSVRRYARRKASVPIRMQRLCPRDLCTCELRGPDPNEPKARVI